MKNVLIIGCGLIGSSVLRSVANKRLIKKKNLETKKQFTLVPLRSKNIISLFCKTEQ